MSTIFKNAFLSVVIKRLCRFELFCSIGILGLLYLSFFRPGVVTSIAVIRSDLCVELDLTNGQLYVVAIRSRSGSKLYGSNHWHFLMDSTFPVLDYRDPQRALAFPLSGFDARLDHWTIDARSGLPIMTVYIFGLPHWFSIVLLAILGGRSIYKSGRLQKPGFTVAGVKQTEVGNERAERGGIGYLNSAPAPFEISPRR